MEHGSFFYNAMIVNPEGNDSAIGPMVAKFAETRAIPILQDTRNWKVGLARLSTLGATLDLPLWEPALLGDSKTTTPYVFTMSAQVNTVPSGRITITAGNNTFSVATYNGFSVTDTTTVTVAVGSYTPAELAAQVTAAFPATYANSTLTWDAANSRFVMNVTGPPATTVTITGTEAERSLHAYVRTADGNVTTVPACTIPAATYTVDAFIAACNLGFRTYYSSTMAQIAYEAKTARWFMLLPEHKFLVNAQESGIMLLGSAPYGLAAVLGFTAANGYVPGPIPTYVSGKTTMLYGPPAPAWASPTVRGFYPSTGAGNAVPLLSMGYSTANGYGVPVAGVPAGLTATGMAPAFSPVASPVVASKALGAGTSQTFTASANVLWAPQHGNPAYLRRCSSYQHICRIVNSTLARVHASLTAQVNAAGGVLTTPVPTLAYTAGIFTWKLGGAFIPSLASTEVLTLAQNISCGNFLPFPVLFNADFDANTPASGLPAPTCVLDTSGYYTTDGSVPTAASTALYVSQEYDATGSWCPYVGLTITSSGIPANSEMTGTSLVVPISTAPTIGDASQTVLFDMDLSGDNAHQYTTGIIFSPTIMRYNSLRGSSLGAIDFQVYLRRRDGTFDAWDVPTYGCIDLKLEFRYDDGGAIMQM